MALEAKCGALGIQELFQSLVEHPFFLIRDLFIFFPDEMRLQICENDLPTADLETPWGERDRYLVSLE